jgi:hypothetical protein
MPKTTFYKNNILFDIAAIIYAIGIGIVNTRFKA